MFLASFLAGERSFIKESGTKWNVFEQKYLPNCPALGESFRIQFLPQERNEGSVTWRGEKGFQLWEFLVLPFPPAQSHGHGKTSKFNQAAFSFSKTSQICISSGERNAIHSTW